MVRVGDVSEAQMDERHGWMTVVPHEDNRTALDRLTLKSGLTWPGGRPGNEGEAKRRAGKEIPAVCLRVMSCRKICFNPT